MAAESYETFYVKEFKKGLSFHPLMEFDFRSFPVYPDQASPLPVPEELLVPEKVPTESDVLPEISANIDIPAGKTVTTPPTPAISWQEAGSLISETESTDTESDAESVLSISHTHPSHSFCMRRAYTHTHIY